MENKILRVPSIGKSGINSDIKPWDLPAEFLTSGINFRVTEDSIKTSGGSEIWGTNGVAFNPGYLIHVPTVAGDYWLVAGRSGVYAWDGSVFTDISSSVGYAGISTDQEKLWTGCLIGKIPIINNEQAQPEFWSPVSPGQALQPLKFDATNTFTDVNKSFKIIRSHKNFLFALNLTESGIEYPNSYRWSHPADINGLPFSWDETDPSSLASIEQLGGDSGTIVDGLTLRDSFAIYSENGISILDFTGDEFVFRKRSLTNTFGLITKDCIAEVKGSHFFLGDGDIVVNDGTRIESILHKRLKRNLVSRMSVDSFENSYVVKNLAEKELWFCIPEGESITPNLAYIFNWRDNSWAIRELPENMLFANYGSQTAPTLTWEAWSETWNTSTGSWGSRKNTPLDNTIVGVNSSANSLVIADPKTRVSDFNTQIERVGFPLDGQIQVTTLTRVYPYVEGVGQLIFQFGSQDYANSPIRWGLEKTFDPNKDRKIDVRTTGELHCWRVKSIGNNYFEISGMDFEYTTNGVR